MSDLYQAAAWAFVCGAVVGWILCDIRWRFATRKLEKALEKLVRLVKKGAEGAEKGPAEDAEKAAEPEVKK